MTNEEILLSLGEVKKGTFLKLRKVKSYKHGVTKVSDLVIRLGVNYGNIKAVRDKIGEREVGSLPWGNWVEGYEGLVIEHKGNYYLRVTNDYCDRNHSTYFNGDVEISRADAIAIEGEKAIVSNGNPDVYNIKFENIISIGA